MRPKPLEQEYEVNLDHWNVLTKQHDNRYDFFIAKSEDEAKEMARRKYGSTVDIKSVHLFE